MNVSSELLGRLQPALDKFVEERKIPGAIVMVARYVSCRVMSSAAFIVGEWMLGCLFELRSASLGHLISMYLSNLLIHRPQHPFPHK